MCVRSLGGKTHTLHRGKSLKKNKNIKINTILKSIVFNSSTVKKGDSQTIIKNNSHRIAKV